MGKPADLTGLWQYVGSQQKLDDKRAIALGHVVKDPITKAVTAAPHGTYAPIPYFQVRMGNTTEVEDGLVYVFNDKGDFACFRWNGKDAWEATADAVIFQVTQAEDQRLAKDIQIKLVPNLVLARYDDPATCPSDAEVGDRYVRRVEDPAAHKSDIVAQRIVPHSIEKTFTWTSSAKDEKGVTFVSHFQQPHGTTGEGGQAFGDTFLGDTKKLAQIAFPFYGFNPAKMDLYLSPMELAPTGPGTPPANTIETNPRQTFNGTLVFAFPTYDSTDYVRAVDIEGGPFIPLGLRAQPLGKTQHVKHSEMVSSLKERMQSWSVTLGMSAELDKLMSAGAQGSVHSKVEEQTKAECRYTVSRHVKKDWVIYADLPSHKLHEYFVNAIISNTLDLLSGAQPRWEDFVARYGTHYAHVITQGGIEYAETRFSLKAEMQAYLQGVDLETQSSAVLDLVKVSGKSKFSTEWGKKNIKEVSEEDVTSYSIGNDGFAMGIFFDLRPLDELFSPVFFPYNPAQKNGALAPFIWRNARESFAAYLREHGAVRTLGIDLLRDYTPHKYKVVLSSVSLAGPGDMAEWFGTMQLAGLDDNVLDVSEKLEIPQGTKIDLGKPYSPDAKKLYCTLVSRAGSQAPLRVLVTLDIWAIKVTQPPKLNIPIRTRVSAIKSAKNLVELKPPPGAQGGTATATVKINHHPFQVEIAVSAVDVGFLRQ